MDLKNKNLKEQLSKVPAEKLVDLIFDLANENEVSWSKIERLVSKPNENTKRFLRRLDEIRNRGSFVPWKYASQFADEMSDILEDLENCAGSPEERFSLICEFYKSDAGFFEQADDSSGDLGDVFRGPAIDFFVKFASLVSDKNIVILEILALLKDDLYGVRDDIINHAHKFLNEAELRNLFNCIQSGQSNKDGQVSSWQLESIARQLKDAPLFEKISRGRGNINLNAKTLTKIAEVYFLSGDTYRAQEILDSNKNENTFGDFEKKILQKKIYERLGNTEDLFKIVYLDFQNHFSEYTLRDLLKVTGPERRDEFIQEAKAKIEKRTKWSDDDIKFLVFIEDTESLEKYILKHQIQILEGVFYSATSIAQYLVQKEKYLTAIIVFRGLVAETLKKSIAKYYHHAIKYLEILDQISPRVNLWNDIETHASYIQSLKKKHALKKSLWSKYKK